MPLLLIHTDRLNSDSDQDGVADCREATGLHSRNAAVSWTTDPVRPDTDGDGIVDGEEVAVLDPSIGFSDRFNPFQTCPNPAYAIVSAPVLADSDGDGVGDARELSDGSDPFATDSDGDGLRDEDERAWGSDPNAADTDGDGVDDVEDVDDGASPTRVESPGSDVNWATEALEGVSLGDVREIDSVPQLLGAMSGGSSSTLPVVGWFTGTGADIRDATANLIRRDWGSAASAATGLLPYAGDAARNAKMVTRFAGSHPSQIRRLIQAVASWDRIPLAARIKLLGAADPAAGQLTARELSDEQIIKFAKRGTQLAALVEQLDRSVKVIEGLPSAYSNSDGFASSAADAERALRTYAEGAGDAPVYIGGFPTNRFVGGRLIDACTGCQPSPTPSRSVLRVAKLGSQPYSETLQGQIDKDEFLIHEGYEVEWHFFAGDDGGDVDSRLLDALDGAGIPFYSHLPG